MDIQAAAGSSHSSTDGDEPELLVRRASIAAREAARLDVSYFRYRGGLDRENPERLAMAAELRAAIDREELTLHYQPKLDLAAGTVCGAEALIRWFHPTRGPVSPVQFIPIAEQTGLVRRLTRNVMEMAMTQQSTWTAAGTRIPIAINLSARDLYDAQFVRRVSEHFERHNLTPESIEFEITEGTLVTDPVTARNVLVELRALGTKIYIDDFGTGYSSLNYLVHLPVHALKIDRSFVKRMQTSRESRSVIASVISMAHNLDLRVVAEGVETQSDLDMLRTMGCDEAQGYFIGRPVAASEFNKGPDTPHP